MRQPAEMGQCLFHGDLAAELVAKRSIETTFATSVAAAR